MRFLPGFGNRSSYNPTGLATASVLDAGTLAALLFDRLSDFDGAALAAALVRLPFSFGIAGVFIFVSFGALVSFEYPPPLRGHLMSSLPPSLSQSRKASGR